MAHGIVKRGLLPVLVVVLIVTHAVVLYRILSHLAWAAVLGLFLLVVLKHIGLLGSIYAFLKRRARHQ